MRLWPEQTSRFVYLNTCASFSRILYVFIHNKNNSALSTCKQILRMPLRSRVTLVTCHPSLVSRLLPQAWQLRRLFSSEIIEGLGNNELSPPACSPEVAPQHTPLDIPSQFFLQVFAQKLASVCGLASVARRFGSSERRVQCRHNAAIAHQFCRVARRIPHSGSPAVMFDEHFWFRFSILHFFGPTS